LIQTQILTVDEVKTAVFAAAMEINPELQGMRPIATTM